MMTLKWFWLRMISVTSFDRALMTMKKTKMTVMNGCIHPPLTSSIFSPYSLFRDTESAMSLCFYIDSNKMIYIYIERLTRCYMNVQCTMEVLHTCKLN
ncbi:hypothetical protein Hanom_Chr07g00621961 [Helianthus anomalus]